MPGAACWMILAGSVAPAPREYTPGAICLHPAGLSPQICIASSVNGSSSGEVSSSSGGVSVGASASEVGSERTVGSSVGAGLAVAVGTSVGSLVAVGGCVAVGSGVDVGMVVRVGSSAGSSVAVGSGVAVAGMEVRPDSTDVAVAAGVAAWLQATRGSSRASRANRVIALCLILDSALSYGAICAPVA